MKKLLRKFTTALSVFCVSLPMRVYADPDNSGSGLSSDKIGSVGSNGNFTIDETGKKSFSKMIQDIFGADSFGVNQNDLEMGMKIAAPIVSLINTFTIALYVIIVCVFFGQTTIDLFYIFCPIARGMMEKRAEKNGFGEGRSAAGGCISEAAYEAVNGSGGGSSGGLGSSSGERSYGSAILKYVVTRMGELAVFIFFSILFLGGFIADIIIMFFYLLSPVIEALMNLGN